MKKIIVTFYTVSLLVCCIGSVSNAEIVKYKEWNTQDYNYYDVNTYDELYSVYEDLNIDYERCQEELNSEIQSLEDEKIELKQELDDLKQTLNDNRKSNNSTLPLVLMISILINLTTVPYMIYSLKNNN